MAQTYVCDICHEVAGDYMVTYIVDGRVICVGIECLLEWAMPQIEAWQAAVEAHQAAAAPPEEVAASADPTWEDGYPQGREAGPDEETEAGDETEQEPGEVGAASHVDG